MSKQQQFNATAIAMLTAIVAHDDLRLSGRIYEETAADSHTAGRVMAGMTNIARELLTQLARATDRSEQDILRELGEMIAKGEW